MFTLMFFFYLWVFAILNPRFNPGNIRGTFHTCHVKAGCEWLSTQSYETLL